MSLKFSIIMPVYNSEKTVYRAVSSVIEQDYQNFELIVVDDGSKDNSLTICKEFEARCKKIKVITQANSGPSSARNCGLDYIDGDYLMFLDSDDCLDKGALTVIEKHISRNLCDVYFIAWNIMQNGEKKAHLYSKKEMRLNQNEIFDRIVISPDLCGGGYPWNKIWKIKSINDNGYIKFDESLMAYEDKLWTLQNLDRAKTAEFINIPVYNYSLLDSSLSHYNNEEAIDKLWGAYRAAEKIYSYIECNHVSAIKQGENLKWLFLLNYTFAVCISKRNFCKENRNDLLKEKSLDMKYCWVGLKPTLKYLILKLYRLFYCI